MKNVQSIFWFLALVMGTAGSALAATERVDHSGLFVWAFFGFCAVIVVAQVVPALMMMVRTARAVTKKVKEGEPVPVESQVKNG